MEQAAKQQETLVTKEEQMESGGHSALAGTPDGGEKEPRVADRGSKCRARVGALVPLFWFPQKVNENVARVTSGTVVLICVLSIIFRAQQAISFITGGLAADYFFRIVFGGNFSPIGVTSSIIAAFLPKAYVDGAPKQFAAFCGFFFSFMAALMFFAVENTIAASCFLAALAGAAALECFVNFCAGCWMFGFLVKFGLVSGEFKDEAHAMLRDLEAGDAWDDVKPHNATTKDAVFMGSLPEHASAVALRYKVDKSDEFRKEDRHVIRHTQVTWFAEPMGLAGLACAWVPAQDALHTPKGLWQGFGIASAVIFAVLLVLYASRCILYPRKIAKEWAHPVYSNFFSAITITLLLFAYLAAAGDRPRLCEVLFWIAAPIQLLLAVVMVARWIRSPVFLHSVNPAWMVPVLGNFVAAFVAPYVQGYTSKTLEFQEAGYLWFSFALLMWVVLLSITLTRVITSENLEEKLRPSVFIYVAAPAMAGLAYLSLTLGVWDGFTRALFFISWVWFFVMCWLGITGYFWARFEMASWAYVFPLATLALFSLEYRSHLRTAFTPVPAIASLVALCVAAYMCLGFTILRAVEGELFVADDKWGPLTFMKLVHKAFQGGLKKLEKQAADFVEAPSKVTLRRLKLTWDMMALLHEEHSLHEDKVVYPYFESFFPGVTATSEHEHEGHHGQLEAVGALFAEFENAKGDEKTPLALKIQSTLAEYSAVLTEHMAMEENHLNPLARKHMPVVMHIEALRKVYEVTSPATWVKLLPFILESQELYGYRVRTLRCLRWAMPERMEQIGRHVYQGVDLPLWKRLVIDVPEMVPRGLSGCKILGRPGWERYY